MQADQHEVSVVVPTHGRAEFLGEALASVLEQTRAPAEVIVVSDLPDAGSARLVAELARRSAVPIRYLERHGEAGVSASRNHGAAAAAGSVLAFLDDDDRWLPGHLAAALDRLADPAVAAVATWLRMVQGERTAPGLHLIEGLEARRVAAENPGVTGSNLVVRRDAFDAIGGFDPQLPVKNDGDFFYRLLLAGFGYAAVPQELVLQRKHSSGQLTGRTLARAEGLQRYLDKHRARLTLGDRRAIRLQIHRIRYHAAEGSAAKLGALAAGLWNASPRGALRSLRGRRTRDFWLVGGFEESGAKG